MAFSYDIFNNPFAKRALAQVDLQFWISDNLIVPALKAICKQYSKNPFPRFK
jgi:hypothetical protein